MNIPEALALEAASQGIQVGMQDASNRRAFKRNEKLYWESWNATNEYNHPVQQMARLKEAGLNPALMYGKSGGTGNAVAGPTPQSDAAQIPDLAGGLAYSELQLQKSQIETNKANAENLSSQSQLNAQKTATEVKNQALIEEQTGKTAAERISAKARADLADQLTEASLQAQLIGIKKDVAGVELTKAQTVGAKASAANTKANTAKTKLETNVLTTQAAALKAKLDAEIEQIQAQTNYTKMQKDLAYAQREGQKLDNIYKAYKADMLYEDGIDDSSASTILGSLLNSVGKMERSVPALFTGGQPKWMSDQLYEDYKKFKAEEAEEAETETTTNK
jgi:hypothetical protein